MYPLWQLLLTGIVCALGGALIGVAVMCCLVSSQPAPCSLDGCPHRRP